MEGIKGCGLESKHFRKRKTKSLIVMNKAIAIDIHVFNSMLALLPANHPLGVGKLVFAHPSMFVFVKSL